MARQSDCKSGERINGDDSLFRPILDIQYDHDKDLIKPNGLIFGPKDPGEITKISSDWSEYCKSGAEAIAKRRGRQQPRYGAVKFCAKCIWQDEILSCVHTPEDGMGGWDCAHVGIQLKEPYPESGKPKSDWKQAKASAIVLLNMCADVDEPIPLPEEVAS